MPAMAEIIALATNFWILEALFRGKFRNLKKGRR